MRISDWSSDVCSSDLRGLKGMQALTPHITQAAAQVENQVPVWSRPHRSEERRVGKECVSVDLGGRRIIKKKKNVNIYSVNCFTVIVTLRYDRLVILIYKVNLRIHQYL